MSTGRTDAYNQQNKQSPLETPNDIRQRPRVTHRQTCRHRHIDIKTEMGVGRSYIRSTYQPANQLPFHSTATPPSLPSTCSSGVLYKASLIDLQQPLKLTAAAHDQQRIEDKVSFLIVSNSRWHPAAVRPDSEGLNVANASLHHPSFYLASAAYR